MSPSVLSRDMNPLKVATRENMFLFLNYYVCCYFNRSMKSHLIVRIDYTNCQDQYKIRTRLIIASVDQTPLPRLSKRRWHVLCSLSGAIPSIRLYLYLYLLCNLICTNRWLFMLRNRIHSKWIEKPTCADTGVVGADIRCAWLTALSGQILSLAFALTSHVATAPLGSVAVLASFTIPYTVTHRDSIPSVMGNNYFKSSLTTVVNYCFKK